jgi:ABC-type nickel/cobalt efflux system permease component RcnA
MRLSEQVGMKLPGGLMQLCSRLVLLVAVLIAATALFAAQPGAASAHPLGNFTINHFTRIEVKPEGITLFRVLDIAEIPAFQERERIDTDDDGDVGEAESAEWARAKAAELSGAMRLEIEGEAVMLTPQSATVTYPGGQGGLQLIRLVVTYAASIPDGWREASPAVVFEDTAYRDKIGWREVVVRGAPGVTISGADVPSTGVSDELRSYPEGELESPLDIRRASFSFGSGAVSSLELAPAPDTDFATAGNPDSALSAFTDLIAEKELSAGFVIIALLTAAAFGAIHALSPGHGKTIVAAYLVGSRGTLRHAALLGFVVTITHTSSVYLLGFATLYLSDYIVPEDLYPWMGIVSGAIILTLGLSLLTARLRATGLHRRAIASARALVARQHAAALSSESGAMMLAGLYRSDEAPDDHHHNHAHEHDDTDELHKHGWGPENSHAIPGQGGETVTWQRLVGLGVFGGMIPCPSAIVVMLSAIALHRVGFGLVLILAFSAGLAVVLTGIGFAVVYAQRIPRLQRAMDNAESSSGVVAVAVRTIPVFAAVLVTAAGIVITTRAFGQF